MKSISWDFTVDWRKLRLLFALTRAGTDQDPATRATLEALGAVAAARPDGLIGSPAARSPWSSGG